MDLSDIFDRVGGFLTGSGGTALAGAAGAGLLYDAYQDLGDLGGQGLQLGQELAETQMGQAAFRPYTVTTATGGQFGAGPAGSTLSMSPQEQAVQQQLMGQAGQLFGQPTAGQAQLTQAGLGSLGAGQQLMGQPTFGMAPTQAAAQQAFGLGGQFMGAAGMQPADINLLRGQFTGQVGGMLGSQPSAAVGQLGQQALGLGGAGLAGGAPDVTQTFAGITDPGVRQAAGGLAGQLMGAGAAERGMLVPDVSGRFGGISAPSVSGVSGGLAGQALAAGAAERGLAVPDVSQAFAGVGAPDVRTGAGSLAARGLGLGMAGLDTAAPSDVEALRQQYGGLAGQAAQQVLQPTAGREAEVFERIRATQRPEEERQRLALEERLAAQGRLGTRSAAFGGATPEQMALATAQEEAQDRASLAAIQQAGTERQRALGEAQALGGMFTQQAGLSSQLQSQQQQRASQLSQLGLSAERVQSQLEAEGFGRELQLGQAGLQAAQAQSALRSQAQQRSNQLSQLGLSAEQVQQRLRSEST